MFVALTTTYSDRVSTRLSDAGYSIGFAFLIVEQHPWKNQPISLDLATEQTFWKTHPHIVFTSPSVISTRAGEFFLETVTCRGPLLIFITHSSPILTILLTIFENALPSLSRRYRLYQARRERFCWTVLSKTVILGHHYWCKRDKSMLSALGKFNKRFFLALWKSRNLLTSISICVLAHKRRQKKEAREEKVCNEIEYMGDWVNKMKNGFTVYSQGSRI